VYPAVKPSILPILDPPSTIMHTCRDRDLLGTEEMERDREGNQSAPGVEGKPRRYRVIATALTNHEEPPSKG
jgi:hypothetical protein